MVYKKNLVLYGGLLVLAVALMTQVSAYTQNCLAYGETMPYSQTCNPNMPDYVCDTTFCQTCSYETSSGAICNAAPGHCETLQCDQSVNSALDITPPNMTINAPIEGNYYESRRVLLDIEFTEPASVYYRDNDDERGEWRRLCSNCDRSYFNTISFRDGLNNITFRVTDKSDNPTEETISFYVDSRRPRILQTAPRRGFSDGLFLLEFIEANPKEIMLFYGAAGESPMQREVAIDSECDITDPDDFEYLCEVDVDLESMDGKSIEYWFTITDMSNNTDDSRPTELDVDLSSPVIEDIVHSIDGRYITFTIEVVESFLDEVGILYMDDRGRMRETRLCSSLEDGMCEKRVSFRDGSYNVTVYVRDEIGNMVGEQISFMIDSTRPRIRETKPDERFASGLFSIDFEEANPKEVMLHYGLKGSFEKNEVIYDLNSCLDVEENRREITHCEIDIDVSPYENKEIEFYYSVEDLSGNLEATRVDEVIVDTLDPVLHNVESFWEQGEGRYERNIYFSLNITEPNLDRVSYIDYSDSRPRYRSLCTRLDRDGLCERRVSFRDGTHTIGILITDDAGNELELENFMFTYKR